MERVILHVDMDAFFASVEQHDHPEWKGLPVVVGAPPDRRGVVAAASYEARRFGIHSAMPSSEAGRRCPNAIFVPPRMKRYQDVSSTVFEIFARFSPLIEPLSVDEAFLDVSGALSLFGSGLDIANAIRRAIHRETGLTASVGIASNKFLAKLASDMNKPDGVTIVPSAFDEMIAFLAPLPVGKIWGVGAVLQRQLNEAGILTIGNLQQTLPHRLEALTGKHTADHLLRLAFGEDSREVQTLQEEKSISKEHTFGRDVRDADRLERTLLELVDEVGARLREKGRYAGTARLKLRWHTFKTITRQRPIEPPCCDDFTLRSIARAMLHAEGVRQAVRLIGFGVTDLTEHPPAQLSLFDDGKASQDKRERLCRTVDNLRKRFGTAAPERAGRKEDPCDGAS